MAGSLRAVMTSCAIAALLTGAGCGSRMDPKNTHEMTLPDGSHDALRNLAERRVFFAHQSVGDNIVEGLMYLRTSGNVDALNVVELENLTSEPSRFFAHARLGTNGNPQSKTDAFVAALEGGLGDRVDVAFQKYCFADFEANTDAEHVFGYYRSSIERLHREFPGVTFVHVTAPLVRVQAGPKGLVKKLLGRMPDNYAENFARERFNDLMRSQYKGREPFFDLAAIEASRPGAAPLLMEFRASRTYTLRPEYTSDGAHLNEGAQRWVAGQLVTFLDTIIRRGRSSVAQNR